MNMWSKFVRLAASLVLAVFILLLIFQFTALFRPAAAAETLHQSADGLWREVHEASVTGAGERLIVPDRYRTVALQVDALRQVLDQAPDEQAPVVAGVAVLTLPLPEGGFGRFEIVNSPMMEPELAARFPEMTTYAARGLDDITASGRLDWTPAGFHAQIFSDQGTFYIDPYQRGDIVHYITYLKRDFTPPVPFMPEIGVVGADDPVMQELASRVASGQINTTTGATLRTYRLAQAATGEYTQFHGGTVADGMAAVVTAINRVNGIYEREVAIRMILVANNHLIVYTNPNTDPYTNNNGSIMLGQNQNNLDMVIGNANYDIGHVFSTGGGGIAGLGVTCRAGLKARGVTGLPAPTGDPFYVDYVSHEMGHQYGANHTFNGNAGSCTGSNRNAATAYEPGSGTTIMAYAGICGNQNIQSNSDDYFHTISFDEIVAYTRSSLGDTCGTDIDTGNGAPIVSVPAGGFTIPIGTPFTLTGSAVDPDGDPLTFNWEQFDLGPAGHPNSPSGNAPLFRSFPATASPSRTFPQISDIANNTQTLGEILPMTTRALTFRLTVRDNRIWPSGGGVAYAAVAFSSTAAAGPFVVTAPNTAVTWFAEQPHSVTWNVANTNVAPVNCSGVDILLSTDGGYNYPLTLASNVANNGAATVIAPSLDTTTARVKVACANNIFFDISNVNFTITTGAAPTATPTGMPTATATATNTPVATATPSGRTTPTPAASPTPSTTPATTATPAATATPGGGRQTPTPTASAPTPTPTTPSDTPTPSPTPISGNTFTFDPVADAFVRESRPNNNFGSSLVLETGSSPTSNSYLRFEVQDLNAPVVQATLYVFAQSNSPVGFNVLAVADNSWSESTLIFNNAPAAGALINSSGPVTGGAWVAVDVTGYLAGQGNYSLMLAGAEATTRTYSSRESANPPQLVIVTAGP
jgi:hypothetical protein